MSGIAIISILHGCSRQGCTIGCFQQHLRFLFTSVVEMILFCVQNSAALAEDTSKSTGTVNDVRSAAMATVNTAAMTTASSAAAALFDAVEDSDSSASSDMLQTSQVLFYVSVISYLF